MRKMKPERKGSFRKVLDRALGTGRDSDLHSMCQAETNPVISERLTDYNLTQTALREAEQVRAKAILELERKSRLV